jgi:hypothetical protein
MKREKNLRRLCGKITRDTHLILFQPLTSLYFSLFLPTNVFAAIFTFVQFYTKGSVIFPNLLVSRAGIFKESMGARRNRVIVPARQAT